MAGSGRRSATRISDSRQACAICGSRTGVIIDMSTSGRSAGARNQGTSTVSRGPDFTKLPRPTSPEIRSARISSS